MRLSWNEIRTRAAIFAREWAESSYEKGETQNFYNDFFQIFCEEHVKRLDNRLGFIDLFWPGVNIAEQRSPGRDLDQAYGQDGEHVDASPYNPAVTLCVVEGLPEFRAL